MRGISCNIGLHMPTVIKKRRHLYTRFPLGLLIILLIAISPILIGMIGALITEWQTGNPCHEGNCVWGALGWFAFVTIPFAGLLFLIFIIIILKDIYQLKR